MLSAPDVRAASQTRMIRPDYSLVGGDPILKKNKDPIIQESKSKIKL